MATLYKLSAALGTVNWNAGTSWSLTSSIVLNNPSNLFPVAGDIVIFDGSSSNVVINVASTCTSLNFGGFTGNMDMQNTLTIVSVGTLVFSSSMTITGSSGLIFSLTTGSIQTTSNGFVWTNSLTINGTNPTITLNDNFLISGLTTIATTSTTNINGAFEFRCQGLTISSTAVITGTAKIRFNYNGGTWTMSNASAEFRSSVDIAANLTIGTNIYYNSGVLTYLSGTVTTTGSTLNITSTQANYNTTLNTNGITWNNIIINKTTAAALNVTLSSLLSASGTLRITGTQAITFLGTAGFNVNTFTILTTSAVTHTFVSSLTYTITNSFTANPTGTTLVTLAASTATPAIINYNGTFASQSIIHINVTNINSSGGNTLYTLSGTISGTTTNWVRADLYFINAGTDWATATNWSLLSGGAANGIEPTSIDNVFFDGNSANCNVPAGTRACANFNTTSLYNNQLNLNADVFINGNLTLGSAGMTFGAGTGFLNIRYTANSQTRTLDVATGLTVPRLAFGSLVALTGSTISLTRSTTITNLINAAGAGGTYTITGAFTLTLSNGSFTRNFSAGTILSSTTTFEFSGTCTMGSSNSFSGGTIKTLTGASLTVTGNWTYGSSGTIDFSLGTVNFGTTSFQQNANLTLNFPASVGSFYDYGGGFVTLTLQSDVTVSRDYLITGGSAGHAINGAFKFIIQRNASINGGATISGTATISFEGTANNGAIVITGTVTFSIATLNIQKGTATFTLDNGIFLLRISSANYTVTSGTIINVTSTLDFSGNQTITHTVPATYFNITIVTLTATKTLNGNIWNIAGTLTVNINVAFQGTAGWTAANFTNTTAGTIITFANINTSPTAVYTVNNVLTIIGTALSRITLQAAGRVNFNGGIAIPVPPATTSVMTTVGAQSLLVGMTVSQATGQAPTGLLSLLPNRPTITSQISFTTWNLSQSVNPAIASPTALAAGFKAIFTLAAGASQTVAYVTTQDIDSSGGQTVWAFQSDQDQQSGSNVSLYRTINWNSLTAPKMAYYTWVG